MHSNTTFLVYYPTHMIDGTLGGGGISSLRHQQRRPFIRGSTMSMVASPTAAAQGILTNNTLGYHKKNKSHGDAISVKSVQIGRNDSASGSCRSLHRHRNGLKIVCRDDDKDPLLSSLMASPSKRSLAASQSGPSHALSQPLLSSPTPTNMFMHRDESGLTGDEIAG